MDKALVSVCVPTYNQEHVLKDALEGILMQDYHQIEIILANDGSTDGTGRICEEYKNKYPHLIKYINQPKNKGIILNTKDCLLAATGKYIAVCEGDDYWTSTDKLSRQVEVLEKFSDVSMVHTGWTDLYSDGSTCVQTNLSGSLVCEEQAGYESFLEIYCTKYKGIRFSSVMFRAETFRLALSKHPDFFHPKFSTVDIGMFYVMAYYGRLFYISDSTVMYRFQNGSVSVNKDPDRLNKFGLGVLTLKAYFCKEFNVPQKIVDDTFRHSLQALCPYVLTYSNRLMADEICNLAKLYNYKLRVGQKICLFGVRHNWAKGCIGLIINSFQ